MSTKSNAQRTTTDAKAAPSSAPPCPSPSKALRREPLLGNFAMQRLVQAQLRVGRPDDPQEIEADRVASSLGSASCGGCSAAAPCSACAEKHIRRKPAARTPSHAPSVPVAQLARLVSGSPLDSATRTRMQQVFGRDLARVRVHTSTDAAESARRISARAFTTGSNIVFDHGEYRPGTVEGDRLLAHELTHVVQNGGEESPIRRVVTGDIRTMSISEPWARDLTALELTEQLEIVNGELSKTAAATPEHQTASENLGVLQAEYRRRNPNTPAPGQLVPRPPGLPLQGGYQLVPLQLPSDVVDQIPDGQLVNLDAVGGGGTGQGAPAAAGVGPLSYVTDRPSTLATSVAGGTWSGLRTNLSTYGFEAAGSDAIGLVAFPRYAPGRFLQGMSSLVPEHPVLWGHTAVYVRQGGRIVAVRSYAPASLLEAGLTPGVEAGTAGVPASIYNESGVIDIFNVSNARSMEWAVPADQAAAFAEGLPEGARYGLGDAIEGAMYTARPGLSACEGTNCIGWAMPQAEGQLGTIAAADTPGVSIGSQTQFSQGRLIRFMRAAQENPNTVAAIQGAEGDLPMVAGSLSRGMQVLKWGGRVMLVVAVVSIPVEVALAKPEERTKTAVGATAGFLGGLGAGALAGLACGPGAPVCSVLLGIGFGIAGVYGARKLAEATYDAATTTNASDEDRPQCPGVANCHRANRRRDPWAFPAVYGASPFGGRSSPFAHKPPQQRMLSDADLAAIMQFIRATPSQNQSSANQPASH